MGAPARPRVRPHRSEAFHVARLHQTFAVRSVAMDRTNGNAHSEKQECGNRRDGEPPSRAVARSNRHTHILPAVERSCTPREVRQLEVCRCGAVRSRAETGAPASGRNAHERSSAESPHQKVLTATVRLPAPPHDHAPVDDTAAVGATNLHDAHIACARTRSWRRRASANVWTYEAQAARAGRAALDWRFPARGHDPREAQLPARCPSTAILRDLRLMFPGVSRTDNCRCSRGGRHAEKPHDRMRGRYHLGRVGTVAFGASAAVFAIVVVCPLMMIAMMFLMARMGARDHARKH